MKKFCINEKFIEILIQFWKFPNQFCLILHRQVDSWVFVKLINLNCHFLVWPWCCVKFFIFINFFLSQINVFVTFPFFFLTFLISIKLAFTNNLFFKTTINFLINYYIWILKHRWYIKSPKVHEQVHALLATFSKVKP